MTLHVIVLAAGKGSRMKSNIPKVLHQVAGVPMLHRVIAVASELAPQTTHLVLGHGMQQIEASLTEQSVTTSTVQQAQQLGTGHAVKLALDHIAEDT
ncbi:MAG: bifunctional N-acetylglucosamine-1-phosphate uridyltransferase/glucosamine-1-phosphate acetyltransferase, partial [Gammaproteobacteria bacterium]|nr:bifunctional N-acetylglucosamine-1-phosphate uridyltransferase/glucosamine-1-phosphate acetyltransferase [Gammaproteobacteria bacterium]